MAVTAGRTHEPAGDYRNFRLTRQPLPQPWGQSALLLHTDAESGSEELFSYGAIDGTRNIGSLVSVSIL